MAAVDSFTPGTLVYFISTGRAAGWQPNKVYEGRIVSMNGNNVMVDFGDGNPMNLPKKLLNRDYNITVNGKTITVNQTILKLIHDRQPEESSSEELGNNIEMTAAANQMLLFGNVPIDAFQEDEAAEQMLTLGNDMTTDSQTANMLEKMKKSGGSRTKRRQRTRRQRKRKSRRR